MQQRQAIEEQIRDLMKKATEQPGEQDRMGMVGFASLLLAAKMQLLLLQADMGDQGASRGQDGRE